MGRVIGGHVNQKGRGSKDSPRPWPIRDPWPGTASKMDADEPELLRGLDSPIPQCLSASIPRFPDTQWVEHKSFTEASISAVFSEPPAWWALISCDMPAIN